MSGCTAEEMFAWLGAILVNAGFLSLVTWGATSAWTLGTALCSLYGKRKRCDANVAIPCTSLVSMRCPYVSAAFLFWMAWTVEKRYYTDVYENRRTEESSGEEQESLTNHAEEGEPPVADELAGDSEATSAPYVHMPPMEDQTPIVVPTPIVVSILYALAVVAVGFTFAIAPSYLIRDCWPEENCPSSSYYHKVYLCNLIGAVPGIILASYLWRRKLIPTMPVVVYIGFNYLTLPFFYYAAHGFKNESFVNHEGMMWIRVCIAVPWTIAMLYCGLSDLATLRTRALCQWGVLIGVGGFFFDIVFIFVIHGGFGVDSGLVIWLAVNIAVVLALILGAVSSNRILEFLAVLGFGVDSYRLSVFIDEKLSGSSAEWPIMSLYLCLLGLAFAWLGYKFTVKFEAILQEEAKILQKKLRAWLVHRGYNPPF